MGQPTESIFCATVSIAHNTVAAHVGWWITVVALYVVVVLVIFVEHAVVVVTTIINIVVNDLWRIFLSDHQEFVVVLWLKWQNS